MRKIICLVVALISLFSLVACKNEKDNVADFSDDVSGAGENSVSNVPEADAPETDEDQSHAITPFYIRYISPEDMAVADSMAEQYGAKVYFDDLKSDDANKQYFAINKLVEYYNDEEVREEAIRAITPFLSNEVLADENADPGSRALADAAAFALSVLKGEFDDPHIIHMADGTIIFTLFNDYSDYGTYNQIWMVKDGELEVLTPFDRPKMYIRQIVPSPDKRLLAITFASNKSSYLLILEEGGGRSPEIVDSARVLVAKDLDIDYWQRDDHENYSNIRGTWDDLRGVEAHEIVWTDNSSIEFAASLWYPGTGEDATFIEEVIVQYDFALKHMEYEIIGDGTH
jgi:hypothetical protein